MEVRIAKVEKGEQDLWNALEGKLSKHEFNGFKHVIESLKDMFTAQFKKHDEIILRQERSIDKNTQAINNLTTTFDNIKQILPDIRKLIWTGLSCIITLVVVILGKEFGAW